MVLNGMALYVAYCATLVGNNILNYLRDPWLATGIPLFPFVNGFLGLIYTVQRILVPFQRHWGVSSLQWLGGLLCAAEVVRPGAVLGLPNAIVRRLASGVRRGGKADAGGRKRKIILVLLLILLAVVVWRRYREGLLTGGTMYAAGDVALRLVVPIIVLFVLFRRTRLFARVLSGGGGGDSNAPLGN